MLTTLKAMIKSFDNLQWIAKHATIVQSQESMVTIPLQETGLDQYAIMQYAEALEVVPRTIAENSGLSATDTIAALYNAHAGGQTAAGMDVETGQPAYVMPGGVRLGRLGGGVGRGWAG